MSDIAANARRLDLAAIGSELLALDGRSRGEGEDRFSATLGVLTPADLGRAHLEQAFGTYAKALKLT